MAKPKNNQNRPVATPKQQPQAQAVSALAKPMPVLQQNIIAVAGVIAVVCLFLYACLDNQFTNWDDPGYVLNNPLVKDMSAEGINKIFDLHNAVMGNYHPLTILSYAFDYSKVALEPQHYHAQSLLFHLLNTGLVFAFVWLLTRRRIVAIITALFFGLHPMHIESVAWVAGRKDVVYGFFYLLSCISYIYYIRETNGGKKWLWYAGVAIMYACSLLSKPVAVVLPVTLLLIDFFEDRIFLRDEQGKPIWAVKAINVGALLDKIPLFILSVLAGIQSLNDQKVFGALNTQGEHFNIIERFSLGCYALITYLWKLVLPIKLLCFYPYPLKENDHLPLMYYIYPVIALLLVAATVYFFRKSKAVVFGILFFLVNIALLLQFLPVGGAIIADRYTYIPYIGFFFLLGWGVADLYDDPATMAKGKMALAVVGVYALALGYMSNQRCKVWYDGMSLWRDVIEVEPVRAPNGYNNLGFFYFNKFSATADPVEKKRYYDSSKFLLSRAIELQPSFVNPYISLGELLRSNNEMDAAKAYYYKALKLDSTADMAANAYLGLSVIYSIGYMSTPAENAALRAFYNDSAIFCYDKTLKTKPYNPEAHSNYANFLDMTGKKDAAIKEYGVAVDQNPDIYQPYLNRARALMRAGRNEEAMKDLNKAVQLEPKLGEVVYWRAQCFAAMGNNNMAQKDMATAQQLGFKAR